MHSWISQTIIMAISSLMLLASSASAKDASDKAIIKHGWIAEIFSGPLYSEDVPECLKGLYEADVDTRHFAKIYYRQSRRMLTTIAEIPNDIQLIKNDKVEFFLGNCSRGEFSRINIDRHEQNPNG